MPRTVTKFRQSVRRAGRAMSFQRPIPSPSDTTTPDRPPPSSPEKRFLRPSRSFPNLSRFVERKGPVAHDAFADDELTHRNLGIQPRHSDPYDSVSCHHLSLRSRSPVASQPLSTSTISTVSSSSTIPTSSNPETSNPPDQNPPQPDKRRLRGIGSSQRIRRLSLGHRSRSKNSRSTSFGESPRVWASSGPSFLSQRSNTDDSLSWSRFFPLSSDLRDARSRKKRHSSYSCSDFEIAEEDSIVEMCERLPDRTESLAAEDIFGRRRGDIILKGESMMEAGGKPLFACDTPPQRDPTPSPCEEDMKGYLKHLNGPSEMNRVNGRDELVSIQDEEEETMKNIEKAIDSSKGRLRNSANMSKAFKAVIKSGEGLVRKSELIQATLNSDESKDPSMIILLDPESCDPSNPHLEGVSTTSEESCSVEAMQNVGIVANRSMGFSTSMTAKQCAATLETILREMACKVSRYEEEEYGARHLIRLKASRQANSGRVVERKIRIMVTIREEDRIRTSVAFRRIAGIYSSRDSHIPLCADIRDRFQREWPAVVEALYIRLPGVPKAHLSM